MTTETISNVKNKYIIGKEDNFGTIPESITQLDFGHVQTISVNEDDSIEEISSINSEHTLIEIDDDLYDLSGSITTKLTHPSITNILEALMGDMTIDAGAGTYTATTDAITSDDLSYFIKFNTLTGKTKQMTGIHFTGGDINITRDGSTEVTLNYYAKQLSTATESLTPETNTGKTFRGLDTSVTYNGQDTVLEDFNLSIDWNYDSADSRGIEDVTEGERRLIQRIIRNQMNLSGSFTSHMDDEVDTGYEDDRDTVPIVLTFSRGTSNSHTWTISSAKTSTRSRDLETGDGKKTINCDYTGIDLTVTGNSYDSES